MFTSNLLGWVGCVDGGHMPFVRASSFFDRWWKQTHTPSEHLIRQFGERKNIFIALVFLSITIVDQKQDSFESCSCYFRRELFFIIPCFFHSLFFVCCFLSFITSRDKKYDGRWLLSTSWANHWRFIKHQCCLKWYQHQTLQCSLWCFPSDLFILVVVDGRGWGFGCLVSTQASSLVPFFPEELHIRECSGGERWSGREDLP